MGNIKAKIAFVFSNCEPGGSRESDLLFKRVDGYDIPLIYLSYQQFKDNSSTTITTQAETLLPWRLDYDREVMKRLQGFYPDLCLLAREFPLIIATLKAFSHGKISINPEKQVTDAEGKPIKEYNITDEIKALVQGTI